MRKRVILQQQQGNSGATPRKPCSKIELRGLFLQDIANVKTRTTYDEFGNKIAMTMYRNVERRRN